jgi:HTH-type transcriptional regulator, transcriptional repressor of NAD biosynthesis genes
MSSILKICLYGPESTGKTFLAEKLGRIYSTEIVPEVAKEFITSNKFSADDIIRAGMEQLARVKILERTARRILICDTDVITTQIYSRHYLGIVPEILYQLETEVQYDQYFLFDVDVPWVADGLRDLGQQRHEMYNLFRNELENRRIPFITVSGDFDQREATIRKEIDRMLAENLSG